MGVLMVDRKRALPPLRAWLYVNGNENVNLTGGWTGKALRAASNSTADAKAPTIVRLSNLISADTATPNGGGVFYTAKKIDLTPYKTLVFEGTFTRGGTVERNFAVTAWSKVASYYTSNVLKQKYMSGTSGTKLTLDVSAVNQEAYIGLGLTLSKAVITACYLVPKDVT